LRQGADQTACRRTAATCQNLLKPLPSLWTFLRDSRVQPTNNEGERALRQLVLKRKISGPTRSRRGDDCLARGFSAHETRRRQAGNLWDFMHQAVTAWIDETAAPSMMPSTAPTG
jgi:transposase